MDLIVSTPQGEAEISVNAAHESVTIADLLGRVLSSAPPKIVYVDGLPTPIGTLISASGLVTGSTIDIVAPAERSGDVGITLVQAAGEGGGNRRSLAPGRYAVGTGRRPNVAPLTFNEVLVPRCAVVVEHSGKVTVAANQGDLDGYSAVTPARWDQQRLRIGHRVFRLDGEVHDRAGSLKPTSMGQVTFVRRPRTEAAVAPEPGDRTRNRGRRLRGRRIHRTEMPQLPAMSSEDQAELAFDTELDSIRQAHLDVAEVIRRATHLSERLWERRPADDDAFVFSVGLADQPRGDIDPAHAHRRDLALLPSAPVVVDLANQRGVGFASTPPQARAAARALVMQACVTHSPADLDVVVLTTPAGAPRWEWVKWLPHARGSRGVQLFSDDETIADWVNAQRTLTTVVASIQPLGRPITPSRLTLAVIDDPSLWRGRAAMLRGVFAEAQLPVRFVALTDRADDIPAVCTTVVRIEANGAAEVDYPTSGRSIVDVVPFVLEHDVAVAAARRLSPLEDYGARPSAVATLPSLVSLGSLLDPDGLDADRIVERWDASRRIRGPRIALGTSESGPKELDLADDGPHVLILGARRSGKTGLLRSIIVSLMAALEPSALSVVCVEPSDGSSFGVFAGVDHLAGAVDNLDEHRGMRLLRSLRSESSRRARLLGERNAATFAEYNTDGARPAIPLLVVVVDDAEEVMARDSTFLPQLIDLADRSRHLGFHLIVAATHLPRSIAQSLKSIANVRIALRMIDSAEATAFIGSRDTVQISMHTPGRGSLRIGEAVAVPVQFALPSAASDDLIEVTPFTVARDLNALERRITLRSGDLGPDSRGHGTLLELVDVVAEAAAKRVSADLWPIICPELPTELAYEQMASYQANTAEADGAPFALSDLPDDHTQSTRRWNPAHDGNLLVIGGSPAMRSDVLATLLVAATDRYPVDELHGYVIDCAPDQLKSLEVLEFLPACGAVASTDDLDRILRVLVHLDAEVERRAALDHTPADPHVVVVVNDIGSLLRSLELGEEFEHGRHLLDRIVTNGPPNGITTLASSASEHAAPARMLNHFQQRIILHLDDRGAYRAMGIEPGQTPAQTAGRAITAPDLVEIQIASIADLAAAVAERGTPRDTALGPVRIARTPASLPLSEIITATRHDHDGWRLPVGIDMGTLQPRVLELHAPGGALVLGGPGTGKSNLLMNIARCALSVDGPVDVHAITSTSSPLLSLPGLAGATTFAGIDRWATEFFNRTDRARLVLIDDADRLRGTVFERLAELEDPQLVVVAAGRTRDLEAPTHWTAPLRRSNAAVILRPLAGDGAMFGLSLRVSPSHLIPGRGVLIAGATATPILIAGGEAS
jgi:DNA segregation ATPase FtsK/SpoIIIE, S-DNA-T family